jgi:hypothetical protein
MDIQTAAAAAAAAASSHFRLKRTRRFHGKNSEVIENIC